MNPFPETADIETSSDDYATRFAGPAGEWFLKCQSDIVLDWMKATPGATILDVGGGHGQLAIPLARAGHKVTVLGSDESCRRRIDAEVARGDIAFAVGNVIQLPYPDRHFDVVVSIRLLPHCERWPELVAELCRVARRAVIVDYPATRSLNVFSDALFAMKKKVEKNTRPYRLFTRAEVDAGFARSRFAPAARHPEFFWPMVLHRMLKRPALSTLLESLPRAFGLTHLLGSPVLARYDRRPD